MNIIQKRLDEIRPYERNPRKNDNAVQYVARSIEAFGFKVPVVIDRDGVIVAGHTRYKAAKELGLETVPCILADDLTPEQVRAFRIVDNKTQELSKWKYDALGVELDAIMDIDMSQFGFGQDTGDYVQDLDDGEEIELGDFEDEKFKYTCPCCGFKFNE